VSHTWTYPPTQGDDGLDRDVHVIHNGDWSGDAEIVVKTIEAGSSNTYRVTLPGKVLVALAADICRDSLEDLLQNWDPTEGMK
jgi:hypothetical protein